MRRPWVVGVEVPREGIGEVRHGRAARVVPLEWWGGGRWRGGGGRAASCSEDCHKGLDGSAVTPSSAGSPQFAWTGR